MAMAGNMPNKKTFEFDIPMELVNFMKKFGGNEDPQQVMEKIIAKGVSNHISETLDELQRVVAASKELRVGLREGRAREETTIQY